MSDLRLNALLKARGDLAAIHAVADRLEPRVRQAFLDAIDQLQGRIDVTALARALENGDVAGADRIIGVNDLAADLKPAVDALKQVFHGAGAVAAEELGAVLSETISFTLTNPRAVLWASQFGGRLITQITEATREGVQALIADGLAGNATVAETARAIRDLVGLTDRQVTALANYRDALVADGQAGDLLARRVDRYATQLLNQRARMISRTETIAAASQGQLELWRQAAANGLIDPLATRRLWIATEDDRECETCMDLDGVSVPFNEPFRSDLGELWGPPVHPNCRCAVGLQFD